MAWLLALVALVERAWVQFLAATSGSQLPITPVPEDRMPSSALLRHQSYIWYTDIHAGKACISIQPIFFLNCKRGKKKTGATLKHLNRAGISFIHLFIGKQCITCGCGDELREQHTGLFLTLVGRCPPMNTLGSL